MPHRMRHVARNLARELRVGRLVLRDTRTPRLARVLLGCGIAYAVSPVDLIPDFIPILGHLDDAIVVPLLLLLGLALVPAEVIREHRETVANSDDGAVSRKRGTEWEQARTRYPPSTS